MAKVKLFNLETFIRDHSMAHLFHNLTHQHKLLVLLEVVHTDLIVKILESMPIRHNLSMKLSKFTMLLEDQYLAKEKLLIPSFFTILLQ